MGVFKSKMKSFAVLLIVLLGLSTSAWSMPSLNLEDYALFALSELRFKGNNGADNLGGHIVGGHIGVNRKDTSFNDSDAMLNVGKIFMSPNSQIVGDTVRFTKDGAVIHDLFTNKILGNSTFTMNGSQSTFTAPLFNPFPTLFPNFIAGTTDITVNTGGNLDLAPGSYGHVNPKDDSILRLGNGVYSIKSLNIGKDVKIYTQPGTIVQIVGADDPNDRDFNMNNGSFIGSEDPNAESVTLFQILGDEVQFGKNGLFYGIMLAPNAQVNLGHSMEHYGRFVADQFSSDWDVNIYHRTTIPEPTSMLLLSSGLVGLVLRRRKS